MILCRGRKPKKEVLLEELAKEDLQVLSLAYLYAKNLQVYGVDVTNTICSAIENVEMLEKAYRKGYHDAMSAILPATKEDCALTDCKCNDNGKCTDGLAYKESCYDCYQLAMKEGDAK